MSLTTQEREHCVALLTEFMKERRPPPRIRDQLDWRYRIDNQSLVLLEVRPAWDDPDEVMERAFAKMTFVRTTNTWKLYWIRASGRWHLYEPGEYATLDKALAAVRRDEYGCFFG